MAVRPLSADVLALFDEVFAKQGFIVLGMNGEKPPILGEELNALFEFTTPLTWQIFALASKPEFEAQATLMQELRPEWPFRFASRFEKVLHCKVRPL